MPNSTTIFYIIISIILFLTLILFLAGYFIFIKIIKRKPFSELGSTRNITPSRININNIRKKTIAEFKKINVENLEIQSFDNLVLRAKLWRNENSKKLIICYHGYTSYAIREFSAIAPFLHNLGYNILFVDDRAHGESDGKYIGFSVLDRYDLQKWVETANEMFGDEASIFLYGISMGATTVALVSGMDIPDTVKGAIFDCGFTSAWKQLKYGFKTQTKLPAFPLLYIVNMYSRLLAKYSFKNIDAVDYIKKSKIPFLFFYGTEDKTINIDMINEIYNACPTKKELHLIDSAEHVGSYYTDTELYEKSVKLFLTKNE